MKNIYTNMCMIYDGENILVQNRIKSDWPGLTFPGGHVEADETFVESVIREVQEETGLLIREPEYVGQIVWPNPSKGYNEIALLYKTNKYSGTLKQSSEGPVFFINKNEVGNYPPSYDFARVLAILLPNLSE